MSNLASGSIGSFDQTNLEADGEFLHGNELGESDDDFEEANEGDGEQREKRVNGASLDEGHQHGDIPAEPRHTSK